jgi:1,4-alpha-glucan branching enzyme
MPADQSHISPATPMGANPVAGGCTFRVWAPRADEVYVSGSFNEWQERSEPHRLVRDPDGYWSGFVSGVTPGDEYKFFVVGGTTGFKRDPYAREIVAPDLNCVVCDPEEYPWHDAGFKAPPAAELVIYQLHVGVFFAVDAAGHDRRQGRIAKFLDVLDRVEYLASLGINAVQLLPIAEFPTRFSQGYNGVDLFSPEYEYAAEQQELSAYLARANRLLAARGMDSVGLSDIAGASKQLKLLIDILHVYGMAVLLDVVYNHAGGDFGDESIYFFDRMHPGNQNDSLYFTDNGWAGGLIFAFWNSGVRQFLIDNALMLLSEYHADGLRYDEVTVIDQHGGWPFCQQLTETIRYARPAAVQIAEYWSGDQQYAARPVSQGGAGFDYAWSHAICYGLRGVLAQAAGGASAYVDLAPIRDALRLSADFGGHARSVQMLENHDLILSSHDWPDRQPRIAALADSSNPRSWYAQSRSRAATGLLLTAPGIPMLFMGEEFLEEKFWNDSNDDPNHRIAWGGLASNRPMQDFRQFVADMIGVRRRTPALNYGALNVFHCDNFARVIAFHRWIEGRGMDVVVVVSLSEFANRNYQIGCPRAGAWHEVFNSDWYDNWPNPNTVGNFGGVTVSGPPLDGLPSSTPLSVPANGVLIFAFAG